MSTGLRVGVDFSLRRSTTGLFLMTPESQHRHPEPLYDARAVPELALEELLRDSDSAAANGSTTLHDDLRRIREAQRGNWSPVMLTWFTDHTSEGHSRRIIELLGQAFDGEKVLTSNELFVLLAACYLHDLGMQDVKIGDRGIEHLDSRDWNVVRDRHPARSRQLITDRTLARQRDQFEIGIPQNSDFLEPIAIVAESHGSRFYEKAIEELRQRDFTPGNAPARLCAVAALLMVGDELDLHRTRVGAWPSDTFTLSPTGQLHFHLHSYVSKVWFTRAVPTSVRRVALRLTFPPGSESYGNLMTEWLARRLLKQIRRTNPTLIEELDGTFSWDTKITIVRESVAGPVHRPLPAAAQRGLEQEVSSERLVARTAIREEMQAGVAARKQALSMIGLREDAESDLRYLLTWILALTREHGAVPLHLDLTIRSGYDHLDLPAAFRRIVDADRPFFEELAANGALFPGQAAIEEARTPDQLRDGILELVKSGNVTLIVQNASRATSTTRAWCRTLLDRAATLPNGSVIVLDRRKLDLPDVATIHRLKAFREEHIAKHLNERLGYPPEAAAQDARALHALAGGRPGPVLLEMLRRVTDSVEPQL